MEFRTTKPTSYVLEVPPAPPAEAANHFVHRLAVETDASDVWADLEAGVRDIVLLDVRSADSFFKERAKGARSFPYRTMTPESTASLDKAKTYVVYCSGTFCNASTKGAARLTAFGFKVKEMVGGLDGWKREHYPTETGQPVAAPTLARKA